MDDPKLPGQKRRRRKHLGGKGLTLDAFIKAKSKPSFDPSQIQKKREFFENAKKVKKYRRLTKQLGEHQQTNRHFRIKDLDQHQQQVGGEVQFTAREENLGHVEQDREVNKFCDIKSGRDPKGNSGADVKHKKGNHLENLRAAFERKKQEEEKARKEMQDSIQAKQLTHEKALQVRKDFKAKMWKKTCRGQPVMKHRLEHILDSLQQKK